MMISRTFDLTQVSFFAQHPTVLPDILDDLGLPASTSLDFTAAVANRENVFLVSEHGGFGAIWSAPRTYEVHTYILPDGRGPWAFEFARTARDWMADHFNARLWTCVHPRARHVRLFTLRSGFKPAGQHWVDPGPTGKGPVLYDVFDWSPSCPCQS
jgi:hypothetical protein